MLGYSTGARLQDAANMKWSAIHVEDGLISFVDGKTNKETITGLHPDLLEWITSQPPNDNPDAPLFPSLAGKKSAGDYGLSTQFTRIMKKAGVAGKELRSERCGALRLVALFSQSQTHGGKHNFQPGDRARYREKSKRTFSRGRDQQLRPYRH